MNPKITVVLEWGRGYGEMYWLDAAARAKKSRSGWSLPSEAELELARESGIKGFAKRTYWTCDWSDKKVRIVAMRPDPQYSDKVSDPTELHFVRFVRRKLIRT